MLIEHNLTWVIVAGSFDTNDVELMHDHWQDENDGFVLIETKENTIFEIFIAIIVKAI